MVELQRVCHKVQSGENLSELELAQLQEAAHESPGVSLKLTAAEALLRSQKTKEAMALLEPLRRSFPKEARVRLKLARCLEILSRHAEAEKSYLDALMLAPDSLEALHGLASMTLRREEWERAREFLERALRLDARDGRTLELSRRLQALSSTVEHVAVDKETFIDALLSRLRQQSTPHLLQKGVLLLRLGKGDVAKVDLEALHKEFLEERKPLSVSVEFFARELAEKSVGEFSDKQAFLSKVLPVLREASFMDRAQGAVVREGPGQLCVFYVVDDAEILRLVPASMLLEWGVTVEELDMAAWKNLEAKPGTLRPVALQDGHLVLSQTVTGLWALAEGDGQDSARLLTQAQRHTFSELGPAPYQVFLGMRELVVLCQKSRPEWVACLEKLEPSVDGILGSFTLDVDGKLKRQ